MHVKRKMALGISLIVAMSINCATALAQNNTFNNAWESLYKLGNIFNRMFDTLSEDDMKKHYGALFTALNNLNNGEIAKWYSNTSGNHGTVEVIATMPNGGILCRKVYVNIVTEKSKKHYDSWACMDGKGEWDFNYR
jgi:surface antigen